MLENVLNTPILAVAMDNMPKFYSESIDTISNLFPDVKQEEIFNSLLDSSKVKLSDVSEKAHRLFIPITDKLLPIHYASGSTSSGKNVVYQDGDNTPIVTETGNNVTLRFEIKSSLSKLSAISDIFHAISDRTSNQPTTNARVSFFGTSICIFNAYLIGVGRSTVANTDKEILSLTLEVAGDETESKDDEQSEEVVLKVADDIPDPIPETLAIDPETSTELNAVQLAFEDIPEGFKWYELLTLDQLVNLPVPDYKLEKQIQRRDVRFFRIFSIDSTLEERTMQTVQYDNKFLALEADQASFVNADLAMIRYDNTLYLGVTNDY